MIVEVLKLANDHIFIPGKDNQMRKMSECPEDYHAYWRLTEYILKMIENTVEPVRHFSLNPPCFLDVILISSGFFMV
jgi:hypothetical protein